jgi:hypothetical protein
MLKLLGKYVFIDRIWILGGNTADLCRSNGDKRYWRRWMRLTFWTVEPHLEQTNGTGQPSISHRVAHIIYIKHNRICVPSALLITRSLLLGSNWRQFRLNMRLRRLGTLGGLTIFGTSCMPIQGYDHVIQVGSHRSRGNITLMICQHHQTLYHVLDLLQRHLSVSIFLLAFSKSPWALNSHYYTSQAVAILASGDKNLTANSKTR